MPEIAKILGIAKYDIPKINSQNLRFAISLAIGWN